MALIDDRRGSALDVLRWLSVQTSEYNHAQWFTERSDLVLIQKAPERFYQMWEDATPQQQRVIARAYSKDNAIPEDMLQTDTFKMHMKFLQRICMLLNDPVKRKLVIDHLVTDPATGAKDQTMVLHFEAKFLGKEEYQLRMCHSGQRSVAELHKELRCPIRFIGTLSKLYKQRMQSIDPLDWL